MLVTQISLVNEFSAMPICFGEFKYCILTILLALTFFFAAYIIFWNCSNTNFICNQPVTLIRNSKNLCVKSSLAKCAEQMLELRVVSHFARFSRTKLHCLRLFLASGLSSPANGTKCKEIPCFVLETLEQPTTHVHIFGNFETRDFLQ